MSRARAARAGLGPTLVTVLVATLAGCGGGADEAAGPQWTALSAGFVPSAAWDSEELRAIWGDPAVGLRLVPEGEERVWVETTIRADEWKPTVWPRVWRAERPLAGFAHRLGGAEPPRLAMGGRDFEYVDLSSIDLLGEIAREPGSFVVAHGNVCALTEEGELPGEARLTVAVERGGVENGRWRVTVDHYTADGIPVWPGQVETVRADVPADSRLTFAAVAREVQALGEGQAARVRFRIRLDGEPLWESEPLELEPRAVAHHFAVALPPERRTDARFTFEVLGAPAITAFLAPELGPAEFGYRGGRPLEWAGRRRPDVVLFVADTFRADNMAFYGSELGLTPNLDRLAGESVRFRRAWSPSTWTLPAHASMFTGLYPHEHGAVHIDYALGDAARTIAEWLRDAGYRTGAFNEAGFLSQSFGVAQGFDWYDELPREFEETAARALEFLERDDGRPVFLFVQTYRVHDPYRASEAARAQLAALEPPIEVRAEWEPLELAVDANPWEWERGTPLPAELAELVGDMHALYLGGVADFDRDVLGFLHGLERAGVLSTGYLIFTSDHGEAFGENDEIHHGTGVFEEHTRIPLLIRGPDLEPRTVEHSATLIDVPQTLAELLDLAPDPTWRGRPLLSLDEDRPVFSFQCSMHPGESYAALIEGEHKVIVPDSEEALRAGRPWRAFRLGAPGEARETPEDSAAEWARSLTGELGPRAAELHRPVVEAESAVLGADERDRLGELGYTGDDE